MTGGEIQSLFLFYNELFTSAWLRMYLLSLFQNFTCSVSWSGI